MARKKVNLQWIANSSTRRATFKKRSKGLMKKISELATLCGIKACVVAYEEGETSQPEVWPPSASEARHVLEKFKGMPDLGKFKKTQSHEDFLHRRVAKLCAEVRKLERENHEIETRDLLHESMDGRRPGLDGATFGELTSLHSLVKTKTARVKELLQQQLVIGQGTLPIPNQPAQSSSSQPQASYTYPKVVQTLAELEEFLSQQQDWPTDLVPNGGELDSVVCSAGYVGTGNLGGDETQA